MIEKDTIFSAIKEAIRQEQKDSIERSLEIDKDKKIISFDVTLNEKTLRERFKKILFNHLKKEENNKSDNINQK